MEERKLTEKQKRFIDFYIETGNATESCRMAGYKSKNYDELGYQNLVKLRKLIDIKLKDKQDERIASQDEVLHYLSSVLRGEIQEECIVVESQGCDLGSIATIKTKQVTPKDRLDAAKQLAKIYGISSKIDREKLEIEKLKASPPETEPIEIVITKKVQDEN